MIQSFGAVDNVCLRNEIDGTVSIQFQAHDNITLDKPENLSIEGVEIWSQNEYNSAIRQDIYMLSNARLSSDQTIQNSYKNYYNTLSITISGFLIKGETKDYPKGEKDVGNVKRNFIKVKFPDARFRFTGKEYVYEIDPKSGKLPQKRDFIRICQIKDEHGGYFTPAYSTKELLVTESVSFETESDIDAQIYFGISSWKKISEWVMVDDFENKEWEAAMSGGAQPTNLFIEDNVLNIVAKTSGGSITIDGTLGENIVLNDGKLYFLRDSSVDDTVKASGTYTINTEEKKMKNNMFDGIMRNFQFGKVDTDKIAYSMTGLAFKNPNGDYVVYNADGSSTNVSSLAFQMPLFAMPTPLAQIKQGDVIVHNKANEYVIVKEVTQSAIIAIAPDRNEIVTIVPQKSIFGFDFYTKIVSPMSMMAGNATSDNPFGNFLPFMLMGDNVDNDTMLMFMMMNGGMANQNMLLPLILMKDGGENKDMMLMLMMMNGNNPFNAKGE